MFTTDDRTEGFLKFNGVQFEYCDHMKIDELHPSWKTNNLGRQNATEQDAILDYACRMEAGSAAPAVIVIATKDGYVILDGVQRICAAEECGATSICAYVVSRRTSLAKQHLIRICANGAINGQHTPDKKFLLEQAVEWLFFSDRCSAEEIARAIGSTPSKVHEEVRFQKTTKLMESVGYDGRLTSRQCKWFANLVGQHADQTDWSMAPGALREMLVTVEKCKFKNGTIEDEIQDFFDIKRIARKDRQTQFESKLANFKKTPVVAEKLQKKGARCHLDKLLPSLRSVQTILEKAVAEDEIIHDGGFALQVAEITRLIYVDLKRIVPRDLQFPNGRRSSIFDKG